MENKNSVGTLEENKENLLEVHDLWVEYRTSRGAVKAVNGLNLNIAMGETLGLVGETGAGKSTTAFGIMRILPDPPAKITGGEILYKGRDLLKLSAKEMRDVRGEEISMIFQDPMTSLDPVKTVGNQIQEMIELHTDISSKEAWTRAEDMLEVVGIKRERANDYPHQFSGGMKQRVVIAMALSCNPKLLIADEPTTALDVTIQAQVLELMKKLKAEYRMSMIMITHDLGVVAEVCDKVAVLYAGNIVEYGAMEDVFDDPRHPYTRALFDAPPRWTARSTSSTSLRDFLPTPSTCRRAVPSIPAAKKCVTSAPPSCRRWSRWLRAIWFAAYTPCPAARRKPRRWQNEQRSQYPVRGQEPEKVFCHQGRSPVRCGRCVL